MIKRRLHNKLRMSKAVRIQLIIMLIISTLPIGAMAQDLHFSQFMNSPLLTNPANTGFIPDGDYRLGVNYRNQWSSIMSVPYKTMSAFGDVQLMKERFENGWVGLGGVVLKDVAGSGNLSSTKIYGSIAYHDFLWAGFTLCAVFQLSIDNQSRQYCFNSRC